MNSDQKFFSKIGFNYLTYLICTLVFSIILLKVFGNIKLINNSNVPIITSVICNYILPFPILFFLMKKLDSENLEKESLSLGKFLLYFCISFTLMLIGNLIGIIITAIIGHTIQSDITNPIENLISSSDLLLNLLIISIIGPIFEELFFRKFLIDRTIKYGAKISIILSAVLFGLMHGNLNQLFYAFLLGGFFAYVYIKTGNIIYTILLHILLNLIGSVISSFVIESANAIMHATFTPFDIGFIGIYLLVMFLIVLFGLLGLSRYKEAKLTKIKAKIELKNPMRTMFLNYGMVCYIGFTVLIILYVTFMA